MRRFVLLVGLALLAVACVRCGPDGDGTGPPEADWVLVWADEFDGEAGSLPDDTEWSFDVGGHGWGNEQLEYDSDRPENVSLDGEGHLAITALREAYQGNSYTSGRIKTKGRFEQTFGRFEARIKLPRGKGIWPAFWMLGNDIDAVGWPTCGEIDIMEFRGQEPFLNHGSLHGPGYSGANALSRSYALPDDGLFTDDFHVFAVEWDRGRVAFSVDDTVYQVRTEGQLPGDSRWVFEHPFFLLLNVAVGGQFAGDPDDDTPFPATMLVDWVRVYRRAE